MRTKGACFKKIFLSFITLTETKRLAEIFFDLYGLSHWTFEFDYAKTRFGKCDYTRKIISLSKHFVEINTELEVRDTILHEIAHALCGPRSGHGKKWQHKMIELGANPRRCFTAEEVVMPKMKYTVVCSSCDIRLQRSRKTKIACKSCCIKKNNGRFSQKFLLEFIEN